MLRRRLYIIRCVFYLIGCVECVCISVAISDMHLTNRDAIERNVPLLSISQKKWRERNSAIELNWISVVKRPLFSSPSPSFSYALITIKMSTHKAKLIQLISFQLIHFERKTKKLKMEKKDRQKNRNTHYDMHICVVMTMATTTIMIIGDS